MANENCCWNAARAWLEKCAKEASETGAQPHLSIVLLRSDAHNSYRESPISSTKKAAMVLVTLLAVVMVQFFAVAERSARNYIFTRTFSVTKFRVDRSSLGLDRI